SGTPSETPLLPPPLGDYKTAKRQFVELYGSLAVMNTYLKIALLASFLVHLGQIALNIKTYQASHNVKPPIVWIDDSGRPHAESGSPEYHPREAEVRYFLMQFVQQYYGRMRATVKDNFTRSLYFLDGRLADAAIEANKKTKAIETFLASPNEEI